MRLTRSKTMHFGRSGNRASSASTAATSAAGAAEASHRRPPVHRVMPACRGRQI